MSTATEVEYRVELLGRDGEFLGAQVFPTQILAELYAQACGVGEGYTVTITREEVEVEEYPTLADLRYEKILHDTQGDDLD